MQPLFAPGFTEERLCLLFGVWGVAALICAGLAGAASRRAGEPRSDSAAVIALALTMSVLFVKQFWFMSAPVI